jgi:hypothetical protein
MSPGGNELLLASGVAPACTPPVCWCFRPGVVAVVLVLLSSSSSSSVPEPSSDSANTTVTFSWMEVLLVVALWDMTPSGLAVSIIRADDGGNKPFRNVGALASYYTASYSARQESAMTFVVIRVMMVVVIVR